MSEFSEEAVTLMCGIFAFGKGTVKSHPPHATVGRYQSAFQELIDAGLTALIYGCTSLPSG